MPIFTYPEPGLLEKNGVDEASYRINFSPAMLPGVTISSFEATALDEAGADATSLAIADTSFSGKVATVELKRGGEAGGQAAHNTRFKITGTATLSDGADATHQTFIRNVNLAYDPPPSDATVIPDLVVPAYTFAGLPAAATAGQLARVSDGIRGPWMFDGDDWAHLTGETIDVRRDFEAKGDGVTDDSAAIQAAFDNGEGRRIFFPPTKNGEYYKIGTPITINIQNYIVEGGSRIFTDFRPAAADISVGAGPNAMFINTHANANGIFRNMRFLSGGASWTGYVFSAVEGGEGDQQAFISVSFENIWAAMGYDALGFLNGGMVDCWVRNCQFELTENVFVLEGAGISGNQFIANKLYLNEGSFIKSTANTSNMNQVIGLKVEGHVMGLLFDIASGKGWQIRDVTFEYNGAAGVDGGFGSFVGCTDMQLSGFKAERLGGDMSGLLLDDCTGQISKGRITGASDTVAQAGAIRIKDSADLDLDDVIVEDDIALTGGQIVFDTCSGSVRLHNVKGRRAILKHLGMGGGASSVDIAVLDSEFVDAEYGGETTNTVAGIDLDTSGKVRIQNSKIGETLQDADESNPVAKFRFTGSGDVVLEGNDYVGTEPMFQSGSTQPITLIRRPAKGADVGSAGDLTLGTDGNFFVITGTTTINAIAVANWHAGSEVTLKFAASVTVKHNTAGGAGTAVLFLSGAADLSATANDMLTLVYDGTQWMEKARAVI